MFYDPLLRFNGKLAGIRIFERKNDDTFNPTARKYNFE